MHTFLHEIMSSVENEFGNKKLLEDPRDTEQDDKDKRIEEERKKDVERERDIEKDKEKDKDKRVAILQQDEATLRKMQEETQLTPRHRTIAEEQGDRIIELVERIVDTLCKTVDLFPLDSRIVLSDIIHMLTPDANISHPTLIRYFSKWHVFP